MRVGKLRGGEVATRVGENLFPLFVDPTVGGQHDAPVASPGGKVVHLQSGWAQGLFWT